MIRHFAALAAVALLALAAPAAAQQPQAEEPPDFWHRDTLTGDWGGLRTALSDQGIVITSSYTAELFANVQGGLKLGATYDGLFLPQVDVDLDKLMGWHGASFRASMIQGHGPALSQGWVGNLMNVSNLVAIQRPGAVHHQAHRAGVHERHVRLAGVECRRPARWRSRLSAVRAGRAGEAAAGRGGLLPPGGSVQR